MTIYQRGSYEIREVAEEGSRRPRVRIDVDGVDALPFALRRLVEIAYDLSEALTALQKAMTEQRKHDALAKAINDLTEPSS